MEHSIDREKVIEKLGKVSYYFKSLLVVGWQGDAGIYREHRESVNMAISMLKEQEAVKPKTGHWIESKCFDECFWVCSECNFPSEAIAAPKLYNYCPNCGAKMC